VAMTGLKTETKTLPKNDKVSTIGPWIMLSYYLINHHVPTRAETDTSVLSG